MPKYIQSPYKKPIYKVYHCLKSVQIRTRNKSVFEHFSSSDVPHIQSPSKVHLIYHTQSFEVLGAKAQFMTMKT